GGVVAILRRQRILNASSRPPTLDSRFPNMPLPDRVASADQLDDLLSTPTPGVIEALRQLDGELLILGVGGKMGPTLARMAARASQIAGVQRRIIGVARFSNRELPA